MIVLIQIQSVCAGVFGTILGLLLGGVLTWDFSYPLLIFIGCLYFVANFLEAHFKKVLNNSDTKTDKKQNK